MTHSSLSFSSFCLHTTVDYVISLATVCRAAQSLQSIRLRIGFMVSHPSFPPLDAPDSAHDGTHDGADGAVSRARYSRKLPPAGALALLRAEAVRAAAPEDDARGAGLASPRSGLALALGDAAVAAHVAAQEVSQSLDLLVGSLQRALLGLVADDVGRNLATYQTAFDGACAV